MTAAVAAWCVLVAAGCAATPDLPGTATETATGTPPGSPSPSTVPTQDAAPVPADPAAYAEELFRETNVVRAAEGLDALAPSSCARTAAAERAADLVGATGLAHAPMDPVFDACPPVTEAAENLSRAAATPAAVVEAWLGSPGHRANLLSETVTQLGVGCVLDDGAMLCSQVYLGP